MSPLPETAYSVCALKDHFGADEQDILLGVNATERSVKTLSNKHVLANYRIVHFSTHGLLAGEVEDMAKTLAEPALVLTPPGEPSEEDDGLLTASEVTQLELDAEWTILSACNTAAGEKGNSDALSGLARAFFYAGARALLVSHWYVDAVVDQKLLNNIFILLKANPGLSRSEALRRAMLDLLLHDDPQAAHPAYWSPYIIVGEGGR
jgi:CHAT domain-containing protein